MKKQLLTVITLLGISSLAHSQGTINFNAGANALTRIATNSAVGGPSTGLISGPVGSYYFALFVAPPTIGTNYGQNASLDPTQFGFSLVTSPTGPYGTNSAAGRFSGNASGTDPLTVNGYPTSSSANFVVVGWSANVAGRDWNAFLSWWNNGAITGSAGWAGHSLVADNCQLGGGAIPAGGIFGANTGQVPGFTLQLIPEPSAFALAGLAGATALIARRRKT